ncbi:MAG: methyl-accepting chemotaxis protein, partial [Pseudomonadota bacterium]
MSLLPNRLSLKARLLWCNLLLAAIAVMVGGVGVWGVDQVRDSLREVTQERLPAAMALEKINQASIGIQRAERSLLIPEYVADAKELEHQKQFLARHWSEVDAGVKAFQALPQNPEEARLWAAFLAGREKWAAEHRRTLDLVTAGKRGEALAHSRNEARQARREAEAPLVKLRAMLADMIARDQAQGVAEADLSRSLALGGVAVGFLIALGLGLLLSHRVAASLGKVMAGLGGVAGQVAAAAGQVSATSNALAEGSARQASALEQTGASLEEMASMTRSNADNAEQMKRLMQETQEAMRGAEANMTELTQAMEQILQASQDTGKIVKTIDEIAFQTNLLALNAAVEAARAGEAGAGFAVVADEVRNLALRAAEAAKNTSALIEQTLERTGHGGQLVASTNTSFGAVAHSAERVGQLVREIATANREQAQGIEQVNLATTEMDRVTQQNATDSEESAAAAQQLAGQSATLLTWVANLELLLRGASRAAPAPAPAPAPRASAAPRPARRPPTPASAPAGG